MSTAIIEQIINILFLFVGKYLIGYRAKIVAVITGISGVIVLLNQLFTGLCEQFHALCFWNDPIVISVIAIWASVTGFLLKKLENANKP